MEKSDGGWQRAQRQAGCESAPDDSVTWRDAAEKIPCSSSPKFYKPAMGPISLRHFSRQIEVWPPAAQQGYYGTVYTASNWQELGSTGSFDRKCRDHYVKHNKPKRLPD
ncbi:MAG: hypothetical protein ABSA83_14405 [Verrucomicrobiota bacterium]|jgi:hypothetical protein